MKVGLQVLHQLIDVAGLNPLGRDRYGHLRFWGIALLDLVISEFVVAENFVRRFTAHTGRL